MDSIRLMPPKPQNSSKSFIFNSHAFTVAPPDQYFSSKTPENHAPSKKESSEKRHSLSLLTVTRWPQLSLPYARCKITNFTGCHTTGANKKSRFSCFRKHHFSRFAFKYGPKMPPERDSSRLRIPFSNRVRGPFWRPKNRFALGK